MSALLSIYQRPRKYWFNFSFAKKKKRERERENPIIRSIVLNISERKSQPE